MCVICESDKVKLIALFPLRVDIRAQSGPYEHESVQVSRTAGGMGDGPTGLCSGIRCQGRLYLRTVVLRTGTREEVFSEVEKTIFYL